MPKTINTLREEIVQTFDKYTTTGTNKWTGETAMLDFPYQVGSLTKVAMQLTGNRYADGKSPEDLKKIAGNELVDMLAEIVFYTHEKGISLEQGLWTRYEYEQNEDLSLDEVSHRVLTTMGHEQKRSTDLMLQTQHINRLSGEVSGLRLEGEEKNKGKIGAALANIFGYIVDAASIIDVNLTQEWDKMISSDLQKISDRTKTEK